MLNKDQRLVQIHFFHKNGFYRHAEATCGKFANGFVYANQSDCDWCCSKEKNIIVPEVHERASEDTMRTGFKSPCLPYVNDWEFQFEWVGEGIECEPLSKDDGKIVEFDLSFNGEEYEGKIAVTEKGAKIFRTAISPSPEYSLTLDAIDFWLERSHYGEHDLRFVYDAGYNWEIKSKRYQLWKQRQDRIDAQMRDLAVSLSSAKCITREEELGKAVEDLTAALKRSADALEIGNKQSNMLEIAKADVEIRLIKQNNELAKATGEYQSQITGLRDQIVKTQSERENFRKMVDEKKKEIACHLDTIRQVRAEYDKRVKDDIVLLVAEKTLSQKTMLELTQQKQKVTDLEKLLKQHEVKIGEVGKPTPFYTISTSVPLLPFTYADEFSTSLTSTQVPPAPATIVPIAKPVVDPVVVKELVGVEATKWLKETKGKARTRDGRIAVCDESTSCYPETLYMIPEGDVSRSYQISDGGKHYYGETKVDLVEAIGYQTPVAKGPAIVPGQTKPVDPSSLPLIGIEAMKSLKPGDKVKIRGGYEIRTIRKPVTDLDEHDWDAESEHGGVYWYKISDGGKPWKDNPLSDIVEVLPKTPVVGIEAMKSLKPGMTAKTRNGSSLAFSKLRGEMVVMVNSRGDIRSYEIPKGGEHYDHDLDIVEIFPF